MKRVLALAFSLIFVMLAFTSCTHVHSFGEWEIETEATCTAKGTRVHRCACGTEEREEMDLAAHQYTANGVCSVCKMPEGVFVDADGAKWTTDEWGNKRRYDDLPVDLNYGGQTVTVLCWNPGKAEFIQTEESEDARLQSVYNRNKAVRKRLGVALNFITEHSSAGSITTFMTRVQNAKNSGTHAFDIIATYSRTQGALLYKGLLYDLNEVENTFLDFSKPWWPANLKSDALIGDSLYFLYGDIAVTAMDTMHCVYFNQDILDGSFEEQAKQEGFGSATKWLYNKVDIGEWTVDLMIDLATSDMYEDKTNNGFTLDDSYGLCSVYYSASAIYGGCGLRMIQQGTNKDIVLSGDFTSTHTAELVAKLAAMMSSQHYHDSYTVPSMSSSSNIGVPFRRGNALFYVTSFDLAENHLRRSDTVKNYGVLPLPKYDKGQENYHTVIGNAFSIYSLFVDFGRRGNEQATASMLTAVLECWASESYRRCTPVVFQNAKQSPTEYDVKMYEYLHDGMMLDLGRIMGGALTDGKDYSLMLDNYVIYAAQQNEDWETYYGELDLVAIEQNLADFMSKLKAGTLG